jgi:hypothetical protein
VAQENSPVTSQTVAQPQPVKQDVKQAEILLPEAPQHSPVILPDTPTHIPQTASPSPAKVAA